MIQDEPPHGSLFVGREEDEEMKVKLFGAATVLALAAVWAAIVTTGYAGTARSAQESPFVAAVLQNLSTESIHVYAASEIYGPGNRLAPGERREVMVRVPPDGRVTFYAVREGWVVAVAVWNGSPEHPDRFPVVAFRGPGRLIVTTALR